MKYFTFFNVSDLPFTLPPHISESSRKEEEETTYSQLFASHALSQPWWDVQKHCELINLHFSLSIFWRSASLYCGISPRLPRGKCYNAWLMPHTYIFYSGSQFRLTVQNQHASRFKHICPTKVHPKFCLQIQQKYLSFFLSLSSSLAPFFPPCVAQLDVLICLWGRSLWV